MGQIIAWECEDTGEIFRSEDAYREHRKRVLRQKALIRRQQAQKAAELEALQPLYKCRSFRAIEKWLVDHWSLVQKFGRSSFYRSRKGGRLVKVHLYNMSWGDQSCSHSAPLGKPSNWCGQDKTLPSRYPGWYGRIDLFYDDEPETRDALSNIGICTGTGGGGSQWDKSNRKSYKLSYDVTIWGEDFPNLTTKSGGGVPELIHDIHHYTRASSTYQAEKWSDFHGKVEQAHSLGQLHRVTAVNRLLILDGDGRIDISATAENIAAGIFGKTSMCYMVHVDSWLSDSITSQLRQENRNNGDCWRRLGNSHCFLIDNEEIPIRFKLKGILGPATRIIDLSRRKVIRANR